MSMVVTALLYTKSVKCSAQVMLAELVVLDHLHFQNLTCRTDKTKKIINCVFTTALKAFEAEACDYGEALHF